jgi:hypothetical protein
VRRPELRTDDREAVEETAAPPPAPAVVPGSLEWASAVGNSAVARLARQAAPEQGSEEEAVPEAEAEEEAMAPEDEEAAAAVAGVDEEQLPPQ